MSATAQTNAVSMANQAISLGQQLLTLLAQVNAFVSLYNDQGVSNVWQALQTCTQNADGSLGTADGTANPAHPINTGAANLSALTATVTANGLMSTVGVLQDFQTLMNGTAAPTQVNRRQALAQNLNG